MVKKTQYTMDKHEQIIRSALQRAADVLIELWVADQQHLQATVRRLSSAARCVWLKAKGFAVFVFTGG